MYATKQFSILRRFFERSTSNSPLKKRWIDYGIKSRKTELLLPNTQQEILGLLTESQDPSFDTKADVLPQGTKKLLHTVGSIAKAKFVSTAKHPYTGIFQSGCEDALLRLSATTPPDITKSTAEGAVGNFSPSISIKFLIDGQPSENLVAMFSTNGQTSWNFFKKDFTSQFDIADDGGRSE
jgi:hypothetical protein